MVNQAGLLSLFISLLGNSTDKESIKAQSDSKLDLLQLHRCTSDWLYNDIVIEMPMNVKPGFFGVGKSETYKCGRQAVAILVSVYELKLIAVNAVEEVPFNETITLSCSVTFGNGEAETVKSDIKIDDSERQQEARGNNKQTDNNIDVDVEPEMLTLLTNKTLKKYGPHVFHCMWNVKVYTPDDEFIKNFAVIISLHVRSLDDALESEDEYFELEDREEGVKTNKKRHRVQGAGGLNVDILLMVVLLLAQLMC